MTFRYFFHCFHDYLVVIHRNIGRFVNRGQLMLCGSHFIMLRLGRHAQLPQLHIQILHEGTDTFPDDAEVMILQLLSLGCRCTEQGTACKYQILSLQVFLTVDQEIFLFRTNRGRHFGRSRVSKKLRYTQRLFAYGFHGTQQGGFFIQRLTRIGTEGGGNAENYARGIFLEKSRGRNIPCGISSGFKSGAQAAGREGRGIRFSFNQLFSGKFHQHFSVFIRMPDKGIMLFRSNTCQRLEPVGIMGRAVFYSPVFHGFCHNICGSKGKLPALVHNLLHLFEYILGKTFSHSSQVEYIFTENCFHIQNFAHFILHSAAGKAAFAPPRTCIRQLLLFSLLALI